MRRWLLNILAALSLLVLTGVVMLWVRSYLICDWLTRWDVGTTHYVVIGLASDSGVIQLSRTRTPLAELPNAVSGWNHSMFDPRPQERFTISWRSDRRAVWFPHWALLPPLLIAPAIWFRRWRHEQHTRGRGFAFIAQDVER